MTPLEIVEHFGLNKTGICDTFDRPTFLKYLDKCFIDRIEAIEADHEISYVEFKDLVSEFELIFQRISSLKVGRPLTKKLWNAFYAKYILPHRAAYFPLTHRRILTLVEKRNRDNNKNHGKSR